MFKLTEHPKMAHQDEGGKRTQRTEHQGLIPGLPNELVLKHIATKIPWSSIYTLTWVNGEWRKAIRSREVYNARRSSGLSQSMLVAPVEAYSNGLGPQAHDVKRHMGFYDVESRDSYMFPPQGHQHMTQFRPPRAVQDMASLPHQPQDPYLDDLINFPLRYTQASTPGGQAHITDGIRVLDGRLYAMQYNRHGSQPREGDKLLEEVQVVDIGACEMEWRPCSTPKHFSCHNSHSTSWAPCNGKLYLFHTCEARFHGAVFDPMNDTCREIEDRPVNLLFEDLHWHPLNGLRPYLGLAVMNKEIYMAYKWDETIMIFDSVMEKWRLVSNILSPGIARTHLPLSNPRSMVVVHDRLYHFFRDFVALYDPESKSWTKLQQTFHQDFMDEATPLPSVAAVACYDDNEVVAMVDSGIHHMFPDGSTAKLCRSVGFGVAGETLMWEELPMSPFKSCLSAKRSRVFGWFDVFCNLAPDMILDYLEL